jgi:hypothetical protein
MGNYSVDCPTDRREPTTAGTTLTQVAFALSQASGTGGIPKDWIRNLRSPSSTIPTWLLTNICRSLLHVLRAITNSGHQDFPNLGPVWYNSDSLANILSLSEVRKVCRVTMDTGDEAATSVHRLNGSVMKFVKHKSGLNVFVPDSSDVITGYSLVSTVAAHKRMFTQREIKAADAARNLYRKIGRPSEAEFHSILSRNVIRNCPVTPDDARRVLTPDIAALKGRTTKTFPAPRVPMFQAVPLPAPILLHHRNFTLCIDLFYVQGHALMFMSLATGAKISRHQWTLVPITDATIARVEALAKQKRQPLIQESGLVVEWQHNMDIDNDVYDRDYDSDNDPADEPLDPLNYQALNANELAGLLANAPTANDDPRAAASAALVQGAPAAMDMLDNSIGHDFDDGFLDGDDDNAIDMDDENYDDGLPDDDAYNDDDYNDDNAPADEYANDNAIFDEAQGSGMWTSTTVTVHKTIATRPRTTTSMNRKAAGQSTQGIHFAHATQRGPGISDLRSTNPTAISPNILLDNLSSMGRSTGR